MMDFSSWLTRAMSELSLAKENGHLDIYCEPKREALILLSHVIEKNSAYILAFAETLLTQQQQESLDGLLLKRCKGLPIAYILGYKEFWSLPLSVSQATLIPRPDTECLIEKILELYPNQPLNVLDMGTGTGAIALALASERSQWKIVGVDFIDDAINLANRNKEQLEHSIEKTERINFVKSDWFSELNGTLLTQLLLKHSRAEELGKGKVFLAENSQKVFDIIVSNPPYISPDDDHLKQGDVRFEPLSALISEQDGFKDLRHIITQAKEFLKPGGCLFLEHGWQQYEIIKEIMTEQGYDKIYHHQDYHGNIRVTFGVL